MFDAEAKTLLLQTDALIQQQVLTFLVSTPQEVKDETIIKVYFVMNSRDENFGAKIVTPVSSTD